MHERHLFEYAVLRIVPRVEREEFVNTGVVLYCRKLKFLEVSIQLPEKRLKALCETTDWEEIRKQIHSFSLICKGGPGTGPIGQLDLASRFRWLTAIRSTVIQTSKVHPGLCIDPQATLDQLFRQLVL